MHLATRYEARVKVARVHAMDQHAALLHVIEAQEQAGDRALARAGRADQRERLAGEHVEAHVVQHGRAVLLVREGDPFEGDPLGWIERGHGRAGWRGSEIRLLVHQAEDALGGRHAGLHHRELRREIADRNEELLHVFQERDERAEGQRAVLDARGALPQERGHRDGREQLHQREEDRVGDDGAEVRDAVLFVDGVEVERVARFAREHLHLADALHALREVRVHSRDLGADAAKRIAGDDAEAEGEQHHEGRDEQGHEGELRRQHEEQHDDDEQRDEVTGDGDDARGEHLVQRVDVAGEACHEPAHGRAVEVGRRERLQVRERADAQIVHGALSEELHREELPIAHPVFERQGAEVEEPPARQRGERAARADDLIVDRHLHDEGLREVHERQRRQEEGRQPHEALVVAQIAEEPREQLRVVGLAQRFLIVTLLLRRQGRGRGRGLDGRGLRGRVHGATCRVSSSSSSIWRRHSAA